MMKGISILLLASSALAACNSTQALCGISVYPTAVASIRPGFHFTPDRLYDYTNHTYRVRHDGARYSSLGQLLFFENLPTGAECDLAFENPDAIHAELTGVVPGKIPDMEVHMMTDDRERRVHIPLYSILLAEATWDGSRLITPTFECPAGLIVLGIGFRDIGEAGNFQFKQKSVRGIHINTRCPGGEGASGWMLHT